MTEWKATYRLDQEEYFTVNVNTYNLPTQVLSEAATIIQKDIGDNTLISLERIM